MCLDFTRHDEEAAVFEHCGDSLLTREVLEMESPDCPKSETGDGGVFAH